MEGVKGEGGRGGVAGEGEWKGREMSGGGGRWRGRG